MKIAMLSHSPDLGGAELCLVEAARGLQARGHRVHVFVPRCGELVSLLQEADVAVSIVPEPWWLHSTSPRRHPAVAFARLVWHTFLQVWAYPRLVLCLRTVRPDVVVSNTVTIAAGAAAAKTLGLPHAWYIHELGFQHHALAFDYGSAFSYRLMSCLSDVVIVCSQTVLREYAHHVPSDKLRLIYAAVECGGMPTPGRPSEASLNLLLIGQLRPEKRQEDAVRALRILHGRGITASLTLLGGDPVGHGDHLRALALELDVGAFVHMPGFTNTPHEYLSRADVLLSCSAAEAFGRSVVEAMKTGKSVVGAASGATAEIIRDGRNGLLYRYGDAEDLADKIAVLDRDRDLMVEMGRNGQAWATKTFTMDNFTRDLLGVLSAVVDRNTRGP